MIIKKTTIKKENYWIIEITNLRNNKFKCVE